VLNCIAMDLHSVVELLFEAVQLEGASQAAAIIAAANLAASAGALADRTAKACGAASLVRCPDTWLLPPVASAALSTLEGAQ
jgi:hypothetical protein